MKRNEITKKDLRLAVDEFRNSKSNRGKTHEDFAQIFGIKKHQWASYLTGIYVRDDVLQEISEVLFGKRVISNIEQKPQKFSFAGTGKTETSNGKRQQADSEAVRKRRACEEHRERITERNEIGL